MKKPVMRRVSYPLQMLFGVVLLGLLFAGCSNGNTPTVSTSASTPTPRPAQPHPISSKPDTGKLPGGQPLPENLPLSLTFNLAYNDAAMERDVAQIYTPGSPTYHQFLTTDQIVQRYALSDSEVQTVENWLKQQGFTIDSIDPLRSGIQVTGTVGIVERALHVQLRSYTILGYTFYLQDSDPIITGQIAALIDSVVGLDNFAFPVFKPPFGLVSRTASLATTCKGYGAKHTLTRDKLASAYQINRLYGQNIAGQGMTIGVAEFDEPFDPKDIATYARCAGVPVPNIQTVNVDGTVAPGPGQGEAALDLELISGLVPQAQIIDYQANLKQTSFAQALVDVFNRVAADHKVQVLSVSYGTGENSFSSSEQAAVNRSLRNLAAEGISVFISSGDCAAFSNRISHVAMVSFPASAPYAIAVGGTHLQVADNGARTSEDVWSDNDGAPLCQNEWGSGGGVSQNPAFKRPSWQVGTGTTNHYDGASSLIFTSNGDPVVAPNGLRQVPDVAAAAFPNIAIYYQGNWYAFGGTSAAAPIWAAGALLVDQALRLHGKMLLGGVPTFYTLANHPGSFHPYTDIVKGDNLFYPATRGWDYATGWGSPNFMDIVQMLSQ